MVKRFDIPKSWEIYSGHDFGSANPAALFLARVNLPLPSGAPNYMRFKDMVIFKEYAPGSGVSMVQHIEQFKQMTSGYTVKRSRGGNFNTEDEIRQGYAKAGWLIEPPVLEKRNSQIDRMIAVEESNRLYIFDDLWQVLGQMSNCMWKLEENKATNEIDNEKIYHLLAALRYIASDIDFIPETMVSGNYAKAVSNH